MKIIIFSYVVLITNEFRFFTFKFESLFLLITIKTSLSGLTRQNCDLCSRYVCHRLSY